MQGQQPNMLEMFLPFIVIFGIFYFMIIRPQGKKMKAHESFLGSLKRGDEVVTASGIIGTIDSLTDQMVTLEVAQGVRMKMVRRQIISSAQAALAKPEAAKK